VPALVRSLEDVRARPYVADALGALAVGLIMSWWAAPFTADRLTSSLFDLYPPVYVGWTLVAFTLGAVLGTALREPAETSCSTAKRGNSVH